MKNLLFALMLLLLLTGCSLSYGKGNFTFKQKSNPLSYESFNHPGSFIKQFPVFVPGEDKDFNIEIGIRDELYLMFADLYDHNSSNTGNTLEAGFFPINFHITAGLNYLGNYKIYFMYGIMHVYEDFEGFDGGIFFQSALFDTDLYGIIGLDFFNKTGSSHNLSTSNKENFTFYCLGAGYKLSGHFNIDLMYYIPGNKVYGYDVNPDTNLYYKKINNGMMKLGFEYVFLF